MAEKDPDFETVYQNAENILLDGRISDQFPLYYKSYDYNDIAEKIGQYIIGLYFFNNLFKYGDTEPDIIYTL